MFKGFETGLKAYGKAFNLIFSKGLGWFLLFPLVLNILLIILGFYGVGTLIDYSKEWMDEALKLEGADFWGVEYLKSISVFISGIAGVFIGIIFRVIHFFVFALFGGYIIIILMSPVFAVLSEKTEEILTGNKYPFIETAYIILFFILGFIPIIGQFAALVLFFISSYFYGFSFIDYTNERRRLSIKQSIQFIRKYRGMAIANGLVFALAMMIPLCGTTIAGFVAIFSVVAATVAMHNVVDLSNNKFATLKDNQ